MQRYFWPKRAHFVRHVARFSSSSGFEVTLTAVILYGKKMVLTIRILQSLVTYWTEWLKIIKLGWKSRQTELADSLKEFQELLAHLLEAFQGLSRGCNGDVGHTQIRLVEVIGGSLLNSITIASKWLLYVTVFQKHTASGLVLCGRLSAEVLFKLHLS